MNPQWVELAMAHTPHRRVTTRASHSSRVALYALESGYYTLIKNHAARDVQIHRDAQRLAAQEAP